VKFSTAVTIETGTAFLAAVVLLLGALLWSDKEPQVQKTDFSVTYIGSRMVYLGLGPKLYDLAEQKKLKDSLLKNSDPLIFEHPPFEALLLSPLGALPYQTAYFIWGLINIAIWITLPWLLRPYAPVPKEPLAYFALWILFAPLGTAMYEGQSSLLVLLLYSLSFICLKRGKDFQSGLALGFALFKFQFVVPFALIFILRRKWSFLKGFLSTATVLAVLSLTAVGGQGLLRYIHLLTSVASNPDNSSYGAAVGMATVEGFVHAVFGKVLGRFVSFLVVAAISGLLVLWAAQKWNSAERADDQRGSDLAFAASVVVSLVTGFHMFTHDLSPLMLAMLLVAAHVADSEREWLRYALFGCLTLFWIPPIYFVLLGHDLFYLLFPVLLAFAVGSVKLAKTLKSTPHLFQSVPLVESVQGASEA
jgi:hypothetical protein